MDTQYSLLNDLKQENEEIEIDESYAIPEKPVDSSKAKTNTPNLKLLKLKLKEPVLCLTRIKTFGCKLCVEIFHTRYHLFVHTKAAHPTGTGVTGVTCTICHRSLASNTALIYHMRIHTGDSPFECKTCGRKFSKRQSLRDHTLRLGCQNNLKLCAKRRLRTTCQICFKRYDTKGKLEAHAKTHIPKTHACNGCRKQFTSDNPEEWPEHVAKHTEKGEPSPSLVFIAERSKPFTCTICDKGFARRKGLISHSVKHTNKGNEVGIVNPLYKCDPCDKTFKRRYLLIKHNVTTHGETPPPPDKNKELLPCPECQEVFRGPRLLKMHQLSHLPADEVIKCKHCSKRFSQPNSLRAHILVVHMGEGKTDRYQCPSCPARFSWHCDMKAHAKTHVAGEMIHECRLCNVTFRTSIHYNLHMRKHGEALLFSCNYYSNCKRSFGSAEELKTHIQEDHSEQSQYKCPFCGNQYAQKRNLFKHTLKCETEIKLMDGLPADLIKPKETVARSDSDVKPHECPKCLRRFGLRSYLDQHVLEAHGKAKHKCHLCQREYNRYASLSEHIRKSHTPLGP